MSALTGRGMNHEDLYNVLNRLSTHMTGLTLKIDLDGGVGGSLFNSLCGFSLPATITNLGIRDEGEVLTYLKLARTKFNAMLGFLDSDALVSDTNYAGLLNLDNTIDNLTLGSLVQMGVYEGALVKWLETYISKWAQMTDKLDNDGGVVGTNYGSLWNFPAGLVDATGCMTKPGTGSTVG